MAGVLIAGAVLAAPLVLPALARIARPVTKAAIRLYLEVADDIHEVVAHHRARRGTPPGLVADLLGGGTEELVADGLEVEAEESLAETILEGLTEVL